MKTFFKWPGNKELKYELRDLDKKGVKWLMTQADTPEVRRLFSKYEVIYVPVYRRSTKQFKNELIIKNY